jgi:hypothetical protein
MNNFIATTRRNAGQIVENGFSIKRDARGLYGVCAARRDRSEGSAVSCLAFVSPRRYRTEAEARVAALREAC